MTLIKICGITSLEDAMASVAAGADALGFNFFRPSPRYIEPGIARRITDQLPERVFTVGVFVNEESPETVEKIASEAGVAAVQLHGDESPEFCDSLTDRYVIKVLRVTPDFDPATAQQFSTDAIMLDAFHHELRGGTGQVVDWALAAKVRTLHSHLFLAGGLSPENVTSAINAVHPYAVDACSALESAPGRKDVHRVIQFIQAVREVTSG
jgi:phosphoribosylanthranilate isomerase